VTAPPVDWKIVLQSSDPDLQDGDGTLEILSELAEEEDAVEQLEGWAETLSQLGYVPRSALDWQNESGIHVGGRAGRFSYRVRVDCWERETETGMTVGAGYLRAVSTPRDV
jgi:hypothetical protein